MAFVPLDPKGVNSPTPAPQDAQPDTRGLLDAALAGPAGAAKDIVNAIGKVPSIQGGGDTKQFTEDLIKEAQNIFSSSESIRARGADIASVGGAVEAGAQGLDSLLATGKASLQDAVRAVFQLSDEQAKSANFADKVEMGDLLLKRGASETVAKIGGLALELATDPLTWVGGGAAKEAIAKADAKAIEKAPEGRKLLTFEGDKLAADVANNKGKFLPDGSALGKQEVAQPFLVDNTYAVENNADRMLKMSKTIEDNANLLNDKREELLRFAKLRDRVIGKDQVAEVDRRLQVLQKETAQLQKSLILNEAARDFGTSVAEQRGPISAALHKGFSLFSTYLEKRGSSGQALARLMRNVSDTADGETAKYLQRFEGKGDLKKVFASLNPEETSNFIKVLDGFAEPMSQKIKNLVQVHQTNWDEIGARAIKLGVETKYPGTKKLFTGLKGKSLPHFVLTSRDAIRDPKKLAATLRYTVETGTFKSEAEARAIWDSYQSILSRHAGDSVPISITDETTPFLQWLVNKGQAKDLEGAEKTLRTFLTNAKSPRFGSLEFARTVDIPFYDITPESVLSRYYRGSSNRLAQFEHYGSDDQIAKEFINRIRNTLGEQEAEFAEQGLNLSTGAIKPSSTVLPHGASQAIRNFEVITKLGRAVVVNTTQSKNTASITGILRTARAMGEALTREGQEFAFRSGSIFNEFTQGIYGVGDGIGSRIAKEVLDKTGFSTVEQYNRVVASLAGKDFAKSLAKKLVATGDEGARRMLKQMDLNPDAIIKAGGISEEELYQAARNMATRTQFRSRVMDSPLWAQSSEGKVINQFKNFIENEAKFIRVELVNEARKGNWAPLARYSALAPVLGGGAVAIKDKVGDTISTVVGASPKPPSQAHLTALEKVFDNAASIGAFGMLYDVINSFKYNQKDGLLALSAGLADVSEFANGLVQMALSLSDDDAGQIVNLKPFTRFALSNVPIVGQDLGRTLESEATTKKRYTEAFNTAKEKGLPTQEIVKAAQKAGISSGELRKAARSARNTRVTSDRKERRALAKASPLDAALAHFNLKEL